MTSKRHFYDPSEIRQAYAVGSLPMTVSAKPDAYCPATLPEHIQHAVMRQQMLLRTGDERFAQVCPCPVCLEIAVTKVSA